MKKRKVYCLDARKIKFKYNTQKSALKDAEEIKDKKGKALTSYYCACCGGWHLTSLKKGEFKRLNLSH